MVKIFHVFQVIAIGAYYPKLEFKNHKNQYFSWLLRSEHVETNIFGNRMSKCVEAFITKEIEDGAHGIHNTV